jgi:sialate O-acetylesterase
MEGNRIMKRTRKGFIPIIGFIWMFVSLPLLAEIQLPGVFSDHAVLQRDRPVRVWGTASPGEVISVQFHVQSATTVTDEAGQWEAWLRPESAGGPYVLSISGSQSSRLERKDLLVGDVWIASGQSNMNMPLKGFNAGMLIKDGEKEIAAANHSRIRMLIQKKTTSNVPQYQSDDTWTECTPDMARNFSAVAYLFGREISKREDVPVGLIDITWGSTPAHSWISPTGISQANLSSVVADAGVIAQDQARADSMRTLYKEEDDASGREGKPVGIHPAIPSDHAGSWVPGTLFNAMISPYTRYAIKGVIWYQGETDAVPPRSASYQRVFSTLIQDWREHWAQGDFPFLFVQISSFHSAPELWAQVRDAQRRTLSLVNTGMAVSLDVGVANNIHPPDKQTVAARLAANALHIAYGEAGEFSSPLFLQTSVEGNSIRCWFTHADGLNPRESSLGDFEVAGEDGRFVPAAAHIEKVGSYGTIVATAPSIAAPRFVRYGWNGVVTHFVYNRAGFPLGTFTSIDAR